MKILFIGAHYHALRRELRKRGHECLDVDFWRLFDGEGLTTAQARDRIVAAGREFGPDVVVQWKGWKSSQQFVPPDAAGVLKNDLGALAVYWCVDDPDFHTMGFWQKDIADDQVWDVALTCCKASVGFYRRSGIKDAHYFLPAHDTEWPVDEFPAEEREVVDLVIAGHPYWHTSAADLGRAQIAKAALDAGLKVEVYGPLGDVWCRDTHEEYRAKGREHPWLCGHPDLKPCYKGWLEHEEVWRAYMRGKVVFNNHLRKGGGYGPRYRGYCNDKIFQIAGVGGGVQLMDHQDGISPGVYTAGREYLEYRASTEPGECLESALDLLVGACEHEELRRRISANARERTLAEHTWGHRADQLVEICRAHGKG